ncbi:hypothetical protein B0T19DRAFT_110454 [Cercophora scortea]|uniref:Secreted protein n=1 Tax=Cercophora scortea TaxID=314031 RepID=A0AAE0IX60_9PEZI|nr:hypothetical protein B0T19DRAFT_110454 [Cercophora scortea]
MGTWGTWGTWGLAGALSIRATIHLRPGPSARLLLRLLGQGRAGRQLKPRTRTFNVVQSNVWMIAGHSLRQQQTPCIYSQYATCLDN